MSDREPQTEPLTWSPTADELRRIHLYPRHLDLALNCDVCVLLRELDAARLAVSGETAWLIERGQPEGLDAPEWWSVASRYGPSVSYTWGRDASQAVRYPTCEAAQSVIDRFDRPGHPFRARPVEHGFTPRLPVSGESEGLRTFKERANACHAMPSLAAYRVLVEDMLAALAALTRSSEARTSGTEEGK